MSSTSHVQNEALLCEFIYDIQNSQLRAIVCSIGDEVIIPNMILMLRPKSDARSIVEPEPSALGL